MLRPCRKIALPRIKGLPTSPTQALLGGDQRTPTCFQAVSKLAAGARGSSGEIMVADGIAFGLKWKRATLSTAFQLGPRIAIFVYLFIYL